MSYAWLDYPIDHFSLVAGEAKIEGQVRRVIARLFIGAARRGWDVAKAPLYMARRTEHWHITIRLALTPPPDVIEKWAQRGWSVEPMPDGVRAQLLELLPCPA